MDCQMFANKINIFISRFFNLYILNGAQWTRRDTQGRFIVIASLKAVVALGGNVWDDLGVYHPERACNGASLASRASHIVSCQCAIRLFFQSLKLATLHAGGGFALATDQQFGNPFQNGSNPVIFRMEIITALRRALFTFITNL